MLPSLPTMSGIARPARSASALRVRGVDVEPGEGLGQVRRMVEHAVALVRTGNRESDAADLGSRRARCLQVLVNRIDPAGDGNVRTVL